MSRSKKINILMIEDEHSGFAELRSCLADSGYNFFTEKEEKMIFQLFIKYNFTIILLSADVAGLDSVKLAKNIVKFEKSKFTPVILFSKNKIKKQELLRGYAAGAVDYFTLPVDEEIIKSKIQMYTELFRLRISVEEVAEERLKSSEEKYKSLFDTSKDGIVFMSLEGHIEKANKAYCETLGYELEDLIFTTSRQHTPEKWHSRDAEILKTQVMERGYSDEFKKEYIRKNRTVFPVMVRVWLVRDKKGEPLRLLKVVRDITEQSQLEMRLRQSHKMESVGTIAGGIAHDFNNILGAIIGYAQLAKFNIDKNSIAYEDVENIIAASGRAKDLVTHILGFSRSSERSMQPVQMHHLVGEVLKLIRASFPSTIEITRHIATEGTSVMADSTEMHQVIMNLCTNALHAMEDTGGNLKVTLKSVELSRKSCHEFDVKAGKYVRLYIRDTGCGMDPEIIERIFDPYFTTKEKGAGTGLGLAVVHGIIKNHGGGISVTSELGVGTRVVVVFPKLEMAKKNKKKATKPLMSGTEKILFVDDEPSLVHVEKIMLQKLGYHVVSAASGIDAFEIFSKQPDSFDIVITDMTMPGMTGLELAKKVKVIKPVIPVILCTGYRNKITDDNANENGISRVLLKPVEIRDLATAIREMVEK